jgi:hypothetical protein
VCILWESFGILGVCVRFQRGARANVQVCAWIERVSMNGRAQCGRVAGERGREGRSPIFKFKSSLKTSAIAPHAVVFGVREAPCSTGRSSKGELQQQRVL